ncbi:hypothetical protein [Streptomyces pini]|uniref:Uncharacterized protein n=1 Tax=Streptomyces pini TaxID=1520580 RepID=A0A1I4H945_9ACTN|nr:hypothetical protein [Streptomyces pini]SFL38829.1 hypothetical protein SAMN05192584_11826 [Streptomyces pini]
MEAERREPDTTAQDTTAGASGRLPGAAAVPMRDLLASCAAADAVSTPPAPERRTAPGERPDGEGPRAEAA